MPKMMSKDSQILINVLKVQDKINNILDDNEGRNVIKDDKSLSAISFYIIKLFSMRKNFSGKTKKALSFFDEFKYDIFTKSLVSCFPLMSNSEIVEFARSLSDEVAQADVQAQYAVCIKESDHYSG